MAIQVSKTITGSEPVTLEEAKAWIKSDDADDALVTTLITQTRELVEEYLNLSIVEQEVENQVEWLCQP